MLPTRIIAACFATICFVSTGCHAPPPHVGVPQSPGTRPSAAATLADAKEGFYGAVAGQKDQLKRSIGLLEQLGGASSTDPEVVAYTGACRLLEASQASWFWDKALLAREGLALLDRAVAEAPGDLEVRFLRGVTGYQLPGFVGRSRLAADDLAYVAARAPAAARAGTLDRRAAAAALYYYGLEREREGDPRDAFSAWHEATNIDVTSPGGRDAANRLQGKSPAK